MNGSGIPILHTLPNGSSNETLYTFRNSFLHMKLRYHLYRKQSILHIATQEEF